MRVLGLLSTSCSFRLLTLLSVSCGTASSCFGSVAGHTDEENAIAWTMVRHSKVFRISPETYRKQQKRKNKRGREKESDPYAAGDSAGASVGGKKIKCLDGSPSKRLPVKGIQPGDDRAVAASANARQFIAEKTYQRLLGFCNKEEIDGVLRGLGPCDKRGRYTADQRSFLKVTNSLITAAETASRVHGMDVFDSWKCLQSLQNIVDVSYGLEFNKLESRLNFVALTFIFFLQRYKGSIHLGLESLPRTSLDWFWHLLVRNEGRNINGVQRCSCLRHYFSHYKTINKQIATVIENKARR